ncbi:MAG: hypothetical protein AAF637_02115 [Pseudomonadota bacterium]
MATMAVMSSDSAVDLALLGLLAERPRFASHLVNSVKQVGGDRFTPTAAFVEGRVAHLLGRGFVEPADSGERLRVTAAGDVQLSRLLCLEIDPTAVTLQAFCITLKLSLLHLVGTECRREAVDTLVRAGRRRADRLELAQWSASDGALMERYMALEQAREALELRWMQDAMASEGFGETVA